MRRTGWLRVGPAFQERRSDAHRKVDARLPGKGNSNSHGAKPAHLIITMMKWIRTSRLSTTLSLSLGCTPGQGVRGLAFVRIGFGFGNSHEPYVLDNMVTANGNNFPRNAETTPESRLMLKLFQKTPKRFRLVPKLSRRPPAPTLSIYLFIYLYLSISTYLSIYLSIYPSLSISVPMA